MKRSLESFESYALSSTEENIAFGGELQHTNWTDGNEVGEDWYDTERKRIIYVE
jgi:hypothetical protein